MVKRNAILATAAAAVSFASFSFGDDIAYVQHIKPVFDVHCAACHGSSNPEYPLFKQEKEKWLAAGQGMRMDTYSHLVFFTAWPDTGALMRRLDDGKSAKDGKPGNMYRHLGATEAERQKNLGLFKGWVGAWVVKRWPDISKDEMNGIRVKY